MSEWEPATDAEVAMRDALRTDDQESYFRILAAVDLLLPVSADALAGLAPLGWGTWSTGGRTHVLAFTSPSALQACLADYTGSARRVAYGELADTWPNLEWWLAVNPGLPIEGYLPAWFVAQLSRGDLRLPTRGPAREGGQGEKVQDLPAAAMAANAAAAGASEYPAGPGGPTGEVALGLGSAASDSDAGFGRGASASGHGFAQGPGPGEVGPGGLPIRSPGAVLPSGLPSRRPQGPAPAGGPAEAQASPVPPAYRLPEVPGSDPAQLAEAQLTEAQLAEAQSGEVQQAEVQQAEVQRDGVVPASGFGGALPRRQVTPPSERPPSMAAAAQALAGRTSAPQSAPEPAVDEEPTRRGLVPPVIPGSGGSLPRRGGQPVGGTDPAGFGGRTADGGLRGGSATAGIDRAADGPVAGGFDRAASAGESAPIVPAPSVRPTVPAAAGAAFEGDDFVAANSVEQDLYDAAGGGSTDAFLSTLLLATVLMPVAHNSQPESAPGESGFVFRTEELDGEQFLVVFTSRERLAEHFAEPTRTVEVRFVDLIRNWPDPAWSFTVNPGSPVGAKYPGPQVIALASWAAESGLGLDPADGPAAIESAPAAVPAPQPASDATQHATVMQKTVPAEQVDYFLDRGYDRIAGFVHRASEVEHLRTPRELFEALGLVYDGSPYQSDAKEAFVLRWAAFRPSLYRIPYGGQSEQALRAMDGWVIERPPFRGNGFAPGEGRDVIAEFKVDSVRLPHGAQLWRMDADGSEKMIAVLDCDGPLWRRVGEQ